MNNEVFYNISKIIERDSKTSSYKFALLRGVIDIIQDNSPFVTISEGRAYFPTGLLIDKWMMYYYPILECSTNIPQINGNVNLAFISQFLTLINKYKEFGGFSAFNNDLKKKGIPIHLQADFYALAKKIKATITLMPMKFIGRSISNNYYSIFQYNSARVKKNIREIDLEFLIETSGTFSIPLEYYDAFKILGSFVSGQESILFKWAEFSVNASRQNLSMEKVISEILRNPITKRNIAESKLLYKNILEKEGKVFCVWSGKKISKYDIDHMIPFSVWKNNDLWNLLPSQSQTNNQKRDKIPSIELIEKRKDLILHYWELIDMKQTQRFQKEIKIALLGNYSTDCWQKIAINQLKSTCNYLISKRGYQEWDI